MVSHNPVDRLHLNLPLHLLHQWVHSILFAQMEILHFLVIRLEILLVAAYWVVAKQELN